MYELVVCHHQSMVEKWMLSQAVEEPLYLYVSMPKVAVPKVVQKQIKAVYLTHGEDNQEVRYFSNTCKTHVWTFLRAYVYIFFPFWGIFWGSIRKGRIYNFLF